MGTSVEEPLHESVASLEQAQHPFGENPPKAQPTPGRSGAELCGGEEVAVRGLCSRGVISGWWPSGTRDVSETRRSRGCAGSDIVWLACPSPAEGSALNDAETRLRQTGKEATDGGTTRDFRHRHTLATHANTPRSDLLHRKGWRPEKGTGAKKQSEADHR